MDNSISNLWNDFCSNIFIKGGITSADCIGWVVTCVIAVISALLVWCFIHSIQLNISRNEMVYNVEQHINELYSSEFGFNKKGKKLTVRYLLHDHSSWIDFNEDKMKTRNAQRYVKIRKKYTYKGKNYSAEYISTQALHEMMVIFRELDKLRCSRIIKKIDLSDSFHELIPWLTSGRIQFIAQYLGSNDAEVIGSLMVYITLACYKNSNANAVNAIKNYYCAHSEIHKYIDGSSRFRWYNWFTILKFRRLMKFGRYI